MAKHSLAYRRYDATASRLTLIGCLLMAGACLIMLAIGLSFSQPLLYALLPREWQPIAPAQPGEELVLITTLAGQEGDDPASALDTALLDAIHSGYSISGSRYDLLFSLRVEARVGRLRESPASEEQALDIARRYRAVLVLWGTYNADSYTIHFTLPEPVADYTPTSFACTLPQGSRVEQEYLVELILALVSMRNRDFYSANMLFDQLPLDVSGTGLDPLAVEMYRTVALLEEGRYDEAYTTAQNIVQDYPSEARLYVLLAEVQLRGGPAGGRGDGTAEALASLEQALALDPSLTSVYALRGSIFQSRGDLQAALADYTRVLELSPDDLSALRGRAEVYQELGKTESALADYTALISLRPEHVDPYVARAQVYLDAGRYDEAIADLDTALSLIRSGDGYDPDRINTEETVLQRRAEAYLAQGDVAGALADYEQLRALYPSVISYVVEEGLIYWERGDQESARRVWEEGVAAGYSYNLAVGYNNLAWELALRGYYEPALPYAEQSLSLNANDMNALHTRGYIELELGDYQAAVRDIRAALAVGLNYPAAYRDLGDAYLALGEYELAVVNYHNYLALEPEAADRQEIEARIRQAEQP
jgi:tetratricopeptide (TPR) repeat protein